MGKWLPTKQEQRISRAASLELGFEVIVFQDGEFICQPFDDLEFGFGPTVTACIEDCRVKNRDFQEC